MSEIVFFVFNTGGSGLAFLVCVFSSLSITMCGGGYLPLLFLLSSASISIRLSIIIGLML